MEVPLLDDGTAYALDLDGIDRALGAGARGVLLCNPHNPVGLVHSREQLAELSAIVARHGGFVVSDEIHAPLTHSGHAFTPYLTVSDEAREHGIAAESGSKAFNLAGLKTAFFVAESDRMTKLITSLPEEVTFRAGLFGLIATREGFARSRGWLQATVAAIEHNVAVLEEQLAASLPAVRLRRPDASYLAWLDMSALGWGDDPAQFAARARQGGAVQRSRVRVAGRRLRPHEPRLRTRHDHRGGHAARPGRGLEPSGYRFLPGFYHRFIARTLARAESIGVGARPNSRSVTLESMVNARAPLVVGVPQLLDGRAEQARRPQRGVRHRREARSRRRRSAR